MRKFSPSLFALCLFLLCCVNFAAAAESSGKFEIVSEQNQKANMRNHGLIKTSDGGYAFLSEGAWLTKTDGDGVVQWKKQFTVTAPSRQGHHFNIVMQAKDGGFLVAGDTDADSVTGVQMGKTSDPRGDALLRAGLVVKYDKNGELLWRKAYGSFTDERPSYGFHQGAVVDDGYILMGGLTVILKDQPTRSGRAQAYPFWIVKLNTSGEVVWEKIFDNETTGKTAACKPIVDGTGDLTFVARAAESLLRTPDGKLKKKPLSPRPDVFSLALKLDKDGNEIKQTRLPEATYITLNAISDGYLVTGSLHGKDKNWLAELDMGLNLRRPVTYLGGQQFTITAALPYNDEGLYVAGSRWKGPGQDGAYALLAVVTKEGLYRDEMMLSRGFASGVRGMAPGINSNEIVLLMDWLVSSEQHNALVKIGHQ